MLGLPTSGQFCKESSIYKKETKKKKKTTGANVL